MAYQVQQTKLGRDIIINGFEQGISDSPHSGIANLRNANITSVLGEASVSNETTALTQPPTVNAVAYTTDTSADTVTVSDTTGYYNGMAIELDTVVTSTGIATGRVYWIGDLSGTSFKLYKNASRNAGQVVDITGSDGSGTLSSYTMGKIIDEAVAYNISSIGYQYNLFLDNKGYAWWIDNTSNTPTNNLVFLGNTTTGLGSDVGRAIAVYKNHIIVFRETAIDGISISSIQGNVDMDGSYALAGGGWEYGWDSCDGRTSDPRPVVVGQDDILYFSNLNAVGSISETTNDTLELDDSSSWTKNAAALDLPESDDVISLGTLGTYLLIGGLSNKVYPWDRISSSFNFPILLPEERTTHIVTTNLSAYLFTGFEGRIYETNGSDWRLLKKVPDYLTGTQEPYFTIHSAKLIKNHIYFSFSATENDGTAISDLDGVWSVDITTGVLCLANELSHATNGTTTIISRYAISDTPAGAGIIAGWEDDSSNYGIDIGSSNPYSGGETIIDTDIIPIGTYRDSETIAQIEFKLSKPLVSGESIELQQRSNLNDSFSTIGTGNTTSSLSDAFDANFENVEWLQIRAILTSTDTTPSFVPLREIRIRM